MALRVIGNNLPHVPSTRKMLMNKPPDLMAQVQATMMEVLDKIPVHTDTRSAVITICLDTAKRLAAAEATDDLRELWAERFYQAADQLAQPVVPRDKA